MAVAYPSPGKNAGLAQEAPPRQDIPAVSNPFQTVGIYLLIAYVFLFFSRILDILIPGLRLPLIVYVCMFLATVFAGNLFAFLRTSIGKWQFALVVWLILTVPFSTWVGGSATLTLDTLRWLILAAIINGLIRELSSVSRLMRSVAYAILMGAILSFAVGQLAQGRLTLPEGTFKDPNQYAMTLLFSLPFWYWIARGLSFPTNIAAYVCMFPIFIAFVRAGSRGAGIGFVAFCLVLIWQAPLIRKIPLLIGIGIVLLGSLAFAPSYIQQRYLTFFNADVAQASSDRERELISAADVGSSQARLTLLISSIEMTLQNPIFGVGVGQFSYQLWEQRKLQGLPTLFNETHNTFTQVSSETGVLGLILFIGMLVSSVRALWTVKRLKSSALYRVPQRVLEAADTLLLALVVLCVCGFFLSLAWGPLFFVVPSLIAVFHRAVQNALPSWLIRTAAPKPATVPVPATTARPAPLLAGRGVGRRVFNDRQTPQITNR